MTIQFLPRRPAWTLLLLGVVACRALATGVPGMYDSLLRSAPFGRSSGAVAEGPAVQPLEFRGVLVDGGREYFSVRETRTRVSQWVGVNEPGNPYTIRSYDAGRGILTVEYQGGILDLALKDAVVLETARVEAAAAVAKASSAAGGAGGYRIGHVADEVRRRRPAPPAPAVPGT